jgi:hypothetical protein
MMLNMDYSMLMMSGDGARASFDRGHQQKSIVAGTHVEQKPTTKVAGAHDTWKR